MTTFKEYPFPVSIDWIDGKHVRAHVVGKPPVEIATPPEFKGEHPDVWSPEDFLVAAAASCFAVTFVGLARRAGLQLTDLDVAGVGIVGRRPDGAFGFTRIQLDVRIETPGDVAVARQAAVQAEQGCLVTASLDLPVEVNVDIRGRVAA